MSKNRGMLLEKIINNSIHFYEKNNLAVFHKKNIDIVFQSVKKDNKDTKIKKLENAFLSKKSTVDYYGIYKGKFIAFEAKSVEGNNLPLANIASHQLQYLRKIKMHLGYAFLIIYFKTHDKFYLLDINAIDSTDQKRKSLSLNEVAEYGIELELVYPGILDFVNFLD
ncbi:Holliday junction resolvase RecU [Candidatus Mycoplasma pogonae]